ncbi:hypothetical protein [Candidatus Binatus sp.]|uniref:hypothetical protein n=1 Tax=Candidatus Binatus sp. TaxID=2811406 RepID=UPI002F957099
MSKKRATVVVRRVILVVVAICCCALAGCFEWTEDQQGNLQSVGLPGVPIWKSKTPPAPLTPSEVGFTPEEASKVSGPVLVEPPHESVKAYRYRYYQTGQNRCQEDLNKLLAERAASSATGLAPYCTETPTAPPSKGDALIF